MWCCLLFSLAFVLLISSMMVKSSSEVIMMVSSAGVSSSTIKPNSSSWVCSGSWDPVHGYCESTIHPLVWLWHAWHAWHRGWMAPSFLLFQLFATDSAPELTHYVSLLQLFTMYIATALTHHCCIFFSSFSSSSSSSWHVIATSSFHHHPHFLSPSVSMVTPLSW